MWSFLFDSTRKPDQGTIDNGTVSRLTECVLKIHRSHRSAHVRRVIFINAVAVRCYTRAQFASWLSTV